MTGPINLYNIYLGDFSSRNGTATKFLMDYFSSYFGGSAWARMLTPFYQIDRRGVKTYASGQFKLVSSVNVVATKSAYTYWDIAFILLNLINQGAVPVDTNGIYTVMFRGDLTLTLNDGTSWLSDWCGAHGGLYLKGANGATAFLKLSFVGDPSFAGLPGAYCEAIAKSGTANNNLGADSMVSIYAHEVAETVTDALGAWYSNRSGYEIADLCSWTFGGTTSNWNILVGAKKFLVQQLWLPGKGCSLSL